MLYTQSQLISYAAFCLKHYGLTDPAGGDLVPSHAVRSNWEEQNNIQPLQAGQEIEIKTVDGMTITAEVTRITEA